MENVLKNMCFHVVNQVRESVQHALQGTYLIKKLALQIEVVILLKIVQFAHSRIYLPVI